jgi:hypothetical protein
MILQHVVSEFTYAFDWYLWFLHLATGFDMLFDPTPLMSYRIHGQSLTFHPSKAATRAAEIRLAPLAGLARAATFSPLASRLFVKWRQPLYRLWLVRAVKLAWHKRLNPEWLQLGATAFYGRPSAGSLWREIARHGHAFPRQLAKDRAARKANRFPCSGLSQINHPIFR